jgi:hypothetical protein
MKTIRLAIGALLLFVGVVLTLGGWGLAGPIGRAECDDGATSCDTWKTAGVVVGIGGVVFLVGGAALAWSSMQQPSRRRSHR